MTKSREKFYANELKKFSEAELPVVHKAMAELIAWGEEQKRLNPRRPVSVHNWRVRKLRLIELEIARRFVEG